MASHLALSELGQGDKKYTEGKMWKQSKVP